MGIYSGETYSPSRIELDDIQEMSSEFVVNIVRSLRDKYRDIDENSIDFYDYDVAAVMEAMGKDKIDIEQEFINFLCTYFDYAMVQVEMFRQIGITSKTITSIIMRKGINKQSVKEATSVFQNAITNMSEKAIKGINYDNINSDAKFAGLNLNKVRASITLFLQLYIVNTVVHMVVNALFGKVIGHAITVMVCAPLTEELSKAIAIRGGFEKEFLVVFNVCEFNIYVRNYGPKFGFGLVAIVRTFVVAFHCSTALVQWIFAHAEEYGLAKTNSDEKTMIGQILAIMMHAAWNSMSVIASLIK